MCAVLRRRSRSSLRRDRGAYRLAGIVAIDCRQRRYEFAGYDARERQRERSFEIAVLGYP
jgi:hypothetical protein